MVTGEPEQVAKVLSAYRVYAKKQPLDQANPKGGYGMDHSSVIYLMGPDGKLVTFYADAIGPDALAADLRKRL